ncbi:hypothetical protein Tco_0422708 [Tanacetum coccineum]
MLPATRTRMTPAAIEEMIERRVEEAFTEIREPTKRENGDGHGRYYVNDMGTENGDGGGKTGVVRLTRWFKKMEMVFHISNCPPKYQNNALTWWNSHKRIVGTDAAYAMTFQELVLLCIKMLPEEEDRVEKFIRGLPDNIQGNVIAAEPTRLQDAVRNANNLMDQKLKGYASRNAENKRRFDSN